VFDGAILNSSTLAGDKTNGSLIIQGDSTITGSIGNSVTGLQSIVFNGSNNNVTFGAGITVNEMDFAAASNVDVNGDILMNVDVSPSNLLGVTFNDKDGSLFVSGDITGIATQAVITTDSGLSSSVGTVTLDGSNNQTITGGIGGDGASLKSFVVDNGSSYVSTVKGDMFVDTTTLSSNSNLVLDEGYDLTGDVVTSATGTGSLTLAGGNQTVTGSIGAVNRLGEVIAGAVNAESTFDGNVYATTIDLGSGETSFNHTVVATTVELDGTANFNVTDGTTTANIDFTNAGKAYLNQGLTGNVDLTTGANVYLSENKAITGSISTDVNGEGILNLAGTDLYNSEVAYDSADRTVTGSIGASGASIKEININYVDASNTEIVDFDNAETASATEFSVLLGGDTFADVINVMNGANLRVADGVDLTGSILSIKDPTEGYAGSVEGDFFTDNQIEFLGSSTVTGNVGSSTAAFDLILGGEAGDTVTFTNGTVYADLLKFTDVGDIAVNGYTSIDIDSSTAVTKNVNLGFVGTVDLDNQAGAPSR
jgi:hypothetical protein